MGRRESDKHERLSEVERMMTSIANMLSAILCWALTTSHILT